MDKTPTFMDMFCYDIPYHKRRVMWTFLSY